MNVSSVPVVGAPNCLSRLPAKSRTAGSTASRADVARVSCSSVPLMPDVGISRAGCHVSSFTWPSLFERRAGIVASTRQRLRYRTQTQGLEKAALEAIAHLLAGSSGPAREPTANFKTRTARQALCQRAGRGGAGKGSTPRSLGGFVVVVRAWLHRRCGSRGVRVLALTWQDPASSLPGLDRHRQLVEKQTPPWGGND
jgi:hypothetical protein